VIEGLEYLEKREAAERLHREYNRRLDVEAVLAHYGADNIIEDGDERLHSCLIDRVEPHHKNGDQNPSASANVEDRLYICRVYWGGDMIQLIKKLEQKDYLVDILPIISPFLEGSTQTSADFQLELEKIFRGQEVKDPPLPNYSERALKGWATMHPYLLKRGITLEAASRLQVGYDPVANRIVFPSWFDGKLVGWQKRALTDPEWPQTKPEPSGGLPKYKNSQGFPKDRTLYNLDRVVKRKARKVVVVESPMSVLKAETLWNGQDDDILGATLCTFGAKVTDRQIELLRQFPVVYVYFDDDDAGRIGARKVVESLYRHVTVMHVKPEVGKDLGDYTSRSEVLHLLDTAEPAFMALARWESHTTSSGRNRGRQQ
jgi:hypothetical protein